MKNKINRNEFIVALFSLTLLSSSQSPNSFDINVHINLEFLQNKKNTENYNIVMSLYSYIKNLNCLNFEELILYLNVNIKNEYERKQLLIYKGLLLSHTEFALTKLKFKP